MTAIIKTVKSSEDKIFDYIKANTIGFEDKIIDVWKVYENDIKSWSDAFQIVLEKYYSKKEETKMDIQEFDNKNIKKMAKLYNDDKLDPMNMFMFINSVKEEKRLELLNILLDKDIKIDDFLGVPYYPMTPAIRGDMNKKLEELDNLKMDENLFKLANIALKIKNIENDNIEELSNALSTVCKEYCKSGVAKITSTLFYINPNNFIPINKYTANLFELPSKYDGSNGFVNKYIELCKNIKKDENKLKQNNNGLMLFPLLSAYGYNSKNPIADILDSYKNTKNIILTGSPGTGKTYSIKHYLKFKLEDKYDDRVCFVQFHPSFDYSDFIEGIKPASFEEGNLKIELRNGIFKEFCKKALNDPANEYYFVIDEINRANLSSVFGEILNALEYRIKSEKDDKGNITIKNPEDFIETQYSYMIKDIQDYNIKEKLSIHKNHIGKFGIPDNLYLLATMNDIDRSIDSFDLALRRRFVWVEMPFDADVIRFNVKKDSKKLIKKAEELNKSIVKLLGNKSFEIGHAYFLKVENYPDEDKYKSLWSYHLESLIKEYLRSDYSPQEIDEHLNKLEKEFIK